MHSDMYRIQIHIRNPPPTRVRLAKGSSGQYEPAIGNHLNYYVIFLLIFFFWIIVFLSQVPSQTFSQEHCHGFPCNAIPPIKLGFFARVLDLILFFFECRIRSKNPIADLNYYIHKVMVLVLEYNTVGIRGTKSFFCNTSNAFLSSTFIQCLYYFQKSNKIKEKT